MTASDDELQEVSVSRKTIRIRMVRSRFILLLRGFGLSELEVLYFATDMKTHTNTDDFRWESLQLMRCCGGLRAKITDELAPKAAAR